MVNIILDMCHLTKNGHLIFFGSISNGLLAPKLRKKGVFLPLILSCFLRVKTQLAPKNLFLKPFLLPLTRKIVVGRFY